MTGIVFVFLLFLLWSSEETAEGVKSFIDSYYKLRGGKERDKEDILLFASASQLDAVIKPSSADSALLASLGISRANLRFQILNPSKSGTPPDLIWKAPTWKEVRPFCFA